VCIKLVVLITKLTSRWYTVNKSLGLKFHWYLPIFVMLSMTYCRALSYFASFSALFTMSVHLLTSSWLISVCFLSCCYRGYGLAQLYVFNLIEDQPMHQTTTLLWCPVKCSYMFRRNAIIVDFGGLGVACWPLVPKFARSNPAEDFGFFRAKKSSARLPSEGR
jgi:hypothetical protein